MCYRMVLCARDHSWNASQDVRDQPTFVSLFKSFHRKHDVMTCPHWFIKPFELCWRTKIPTENCSENRFQHVCDLAVAVPSSADWLQSAVVGLFAKLVHVATTSVFLTVSRQALRIVKIL